MAYVKIMIHAVWGTKSREPYLTKEIIHQVICHIKQNARSKEIFIDRLNGYNDHLHCLIGLNADMSIAKAMHLIKGESASIPILYRFILLRKRSLDGIHYHKR